MNKGLVFLFWGSVVGVVAALVMSIVTAVQTEQEKVPVEQMLKIPSQN